MSFNVSDKVVCVDAGRFRAALVVPPDEIIKGVIYVVREVELASNGVGIRLVGIYGGQYFSGNEGVFDPRRFRLLSEMKVQSWIASLEMAQ